MRRKDREMDREFALRVIDNCDYAVLSLITPEGLPYCVPLSIVRIGENLYFHCALEGRKLDSLRANPNVCVSCVTGVHTIARKFTTAYESATVEGKAAEITDNYEKTEALRALCMRYAPENMSGFDAAIDRSINRTGIWKISMDIVSGKCKKEKQT